MATPPLEMAAIVTAISVTVVCGPAGLACSPTGWPTPAHAVSHSVISFGSGMREVFTLKSCARLALLKPNFSAVADERLRTEFVGDLREYRVDGVRRRVFDRDVAKGLVVVVGDLGVADLYRVGGAVDVGRADRVGVECRAQGNDLERGARRVQRLRRAVDERAGFRPIPS